MVLALPPFRSTRRMWSASPTTPIRTSSAPTVRMVCWNSGSLEVLNRTEIGRSHTAAAPLTLDSVLLYFLFLSLGNPFRSLWTCWWSPHHTIQFTYSHIAEYWKLIAVWGFGVFAQKSLNLFLKEIEFVHQRKDLKCILYSHIIYFYMILLDFVSC